MGYFRNLLLKILGLLMFVFIFYKLDIIHKLDVVSLVQLGFFLIVIVILYIIKQLL
jgi:hypothetical protein